MQKYEPYRKELITVEQLKELNQLTPQHVIVHTLLHWVIILCTLAFLYHYQNPGTILLGMVVIGTQYYGLLIIAHDGLHRRLFNDIKINDLWCDLTILGAIGAITRMNRMNHMNHHAYASLGIDPDRFKYIHDNKESTIKYLFFLSGLQSLSKAFKNIFLKTQIKSDNKTLKYKFRDIVILLTWQLILITGFTYFFGWWAYFILWLSPLYLFAYRSDLTRVFCEHSMLTTDSHADSLMRLISYKSNWFEKLFFAPHNMNLHMAHHLWPGIPYYNLPKADRLIGESDVGKDDLLWRDSYLSYLIQYKKYINSAT